MVVATESLWKFWQLFMKTSLVESVLRFNSTEIRLNLWYIWKKFPNLSERLFLKTPLAEYF